jgi:mRNA interferase MazF
VKQAGQIVLFRFPQADLAEGKLRPALLLREVPGPYDDWLICMILSQLRQCIDSFDEVIAEDFKQSGMKVSSVIRVGRLAVVEGDIMVRSVGEISSARLARIRRRLVEWLSETT